MHQLPMPIFPLESDFGYVQVTLTNVADRNGPVRSLAALYCTEVCRPGYGELARRRIAGYRDRVRSGWIVADQRDGSRLGAETGRPKANRHFC